VSYGGKIPKGTDLSLQGFCVPLGGYSISILGRASKPFVIRGRKELVILKEMAELTKEELVTHLFCFHTNIYKEMKKMKKYLILLIVLFFVSGCMASFPAKYDPKYSVNPQLGKEQRVYSNAKFENAFGKEMRDESLKLQVLVDKKIEDWGFNKDRTGKNLDITVKNVVKAGSMTGGVLTGILCGLTLYIIPGIAVDHYRMTVVINEEGKEPITREYNGSMTTYNQIFFTIWGLFVYPPKNAMYTTIDNMLDHFMNDLAEDSKKAMIRRNPNSLYSKK